MKNKVVGIQTPMKRREYTGRHSICSIKPAIHWKDAFRSGNGTIILRDMGNPLENEIVLQHELLWSPQWEEAPKAPLLADSLSEIQRLVLERKFSEAEDYIDKIAIENNTPPNYKPSDKHDAIQIKVINKDEKDAKNYIHVQHMDTGELITRWDTEGGSFENRMFCSRRDNIAVVNLKAYKGRLNSTIACLPPEFSTTGNMNDYGEVNVGGSPWINHTIAPQITIGEIENCLFLEGSYAYNQGNYVAIIRPISVNGKITIESGKLILNGCTECMLLINVERARRGEALIKKEDLLAKVKGLSDAYNTLFESHKIIHMELYKRVALDLKGDKQDYLLSLPELKQKQFMTHYLLPAYLEKMMSMGRYFLICESGEFPPIYGHVNINVNHQISGGNIGNLPEMMESFFRWIERQIPEARENAKRVIGTRGFIIACHPDEESGRQYHFHRTYPHQYWISSSGWCLQPFLEHYYCTGDEEFLKKRVLPLYEELALLYIDYLTYKDEQGNFIFVPSYSPENFPSNYSSMVNSNAAMDIQVCREVMNTLITYGRDIVSEDMLHQYQRILDYLPPYLYGENGEIKEWIEADYEENHDHRHISQLYGAYPGDEFQPEINNDLYRHARYTNRVRGMENESCHGIMHRAQIAARLKDSSLVEDLLRFTLESGYVNENFTTAHNPYVKHYFPDGQGAIPTIIMESLLYSRPGFIEFLPAADTDSFLQGTISGMALRTFGIVEEFAWDAEGIQMCFRSHKEQNITLCYRKGIDNLNIDGGEILDCNGIYGSIYVGNTSVKIRMNR